MKMKNKSEQFPSYIPFYYRLFCMLRKLKRQTCVRISERKAEKSGPKDIVPDGTRVAAPANIKNIPDTINKAAMWIDEDLKSSGVKDVAVAIESLKKMLLEKGLRYTSSAGNFINSMYTPESEKRKLWENAWVAYHSGVKPLDRVLDIGGASTAFVFYLASLGCQVKVVDNDWSCCGMIYNTNYVAKKMNWDLKALDRDIARPLPFKDESFDHVFSICTLEHLSSSVRHSMMREVRRVLKPGGTVGLTIDYGLERKELLCDKGLRFGYREKLFNEVINPSGLTIYGNEDLIDAECQERFLGALFLRK